MTFSETDDNDGGRSIREEVVDVIIIQNHDDNGDGGDYIKLGSIPDDDDSEPLEDALTPPLPPSLWSWLKLGLYALCFGILALVVFQWVGPFFIQKVFIPVITWLRNTFTSSEIAVLVFASIALFPTILLPSSPSMWLAGMMFNHILAFLLVISAAAVGVSLPYIIGSMFHRKIEEWLDQYPKRAAVLRAAGGGNWFHQFRAVALIRLSPFPYIIYNYCSVATNVHYGPYLLGSLVGMAPEIIASIYTGVLIRTLADVSHETHNLSSPQIGVNVVSFCIPLAAIIFLVLYAKRKLKEMKKEDELLLQ